MSVRSLGYPSVGRQLGKRGLPTSDNRSEEDRGNSHIPEDAELTRLPTLAWT